MGGAAEGRDVLGGVDIRRREAVWNGFELEGGKAAEGVGTSGFQQASMIELCVNKGDVKAFMVEELC